MKNLTFGGLLLLLVYPIILCLLSYFAFNVSLVDALLLLVLFYVMTTVAYLIIERSKK